MIKKQRFKIILQPPKAIKTTNGKIKKIWESGKHFDEEYCFKRVKPMSEIIKAAIKAQGGTTK